MEGISDIRVVAVDPKRPPVIRKEPYIDIHFALSHQAPKTWCEDFNSLTAKKKFTATIQPEEGLFVSTWVRSPDDLAENLKFIQDKVTECNELFIAKVRARQGATDDDNEALKLESGEQGRLNRIVSELDFGE